jgi:hypothetical protein
MSTLIVIAIIGGFMYWFFQNKTKVENQNAELKERSDYFDEKFRADYNRINNFFNRIEKLHEMLNDLIMLNIITILAQEDEEKWDRLGRRMKKGDKQAEEEINKWFETTDNKKAKDFHIAKTFLNECYSLYIEMFQLWPKISTKYINSNSEYLQRTLDDIFDASIYFDTAFSHVSEKKLTENKDTEGLVKGLSELHKKLKEILTEIKERYFEG